MKNKDKIESIFLLLILAMNLFGCERSSDAKIVKNYSGESELFVPKAGLDLIECKSDPKMVSILERPIEINTYKKLECIGFLIGNEAYYHYYYSY